MTATPDDIVRTARSYIGTPFHHMGRAPGVGIDCAGVPICIARQLGLKPVNFDVPNYVMQPDGLSMLRWLREHMEQVFYPGMSSGDVVVVKSAKFPQHIGIVADGDHGQRMIIHASNARPANCVVETYLSFNRLFKFVAAFRFRGLAQWPK